MCERCVSAISGTVVAACACAATLLSGCAETAPWKREWARPVTHQNEPYLWEGLGDAEMVRRVAGAFPLGTRRAEVEATIARLRIEVDDRAENTEGTAHVTTRGLVYPAERPGSDDIVLAFGNWHDRKPGPWSECHAAVTRRLWLRFEADELTAVEMRNTRHFQPVFKDASLADLEEYLSRTNEKVFTIGRPDRRAADINRAPETRP